jgi:hypothetical protein
VSLPYDEARAARAMRFLFEKLVRPNWRRIRHVYVYVWWSGNEFPPPFDAGLVAFEPNVLGFIPRPAYHMLKHYVHGPAAAR